MISSQEIKNTFQFSNVQKDVKIYPKWQNCLFLLTQDIIKGTVFIRKDMNSYLPKKLHHQEVLRALCVCFAIFYGCNVLRKRAVFIARKYLFLSFPTYKISYTINTQVSIYIVLRTAYYIYIIKLGTVFTRLKKKPRMIFFFFSLFDWWWFQYKLTLFLFKFFVDAYMRATSWKCYICVYTYSVNFIVLWGNYVRKVQSYSCRFDRV